MYKVNVASFFGYFHGLLRSSDSKKKAKVAKVSKEKNKKVVFFVFFLLTFHQAKSSSDEASVWSSSVEQSQPSKNLRKTCQISGSNTQISQIPMINESY